MEKLSAGDVDTGQQLPGLQGLPAELLDAILRRLDASSRLQVFRTSKLLATALLRVVPSIQLTYPTQHDIIGQHLRELAPFLIEVLHNRQHPKLHLTLESDYRFLCDTMERHKAEPAAAAADLTQMVASTLGAVPLCGAVDRLTIFWAPRIHLPWKPAFSAALAASFPSLTSLTFQMANMSIGHLAAVVTHPLLLPRLLHLDIKGAEIIHEGQLGVSPFSGSRVQTLSLRGWVEVDGECGFLSGLLPFPPTLTQLTVTGLFDMQHPDWVRLAAAVSSLTQLQQLTLLNDHYRDAYGLGLMALLPVLAHLPSLHTLVVDDIMVGQEQLDALLALTQITRLGVHAFVGLTTSQASADCSWRQLEVHTMDWVSAAYLPLHSLTHPWSVNIHQLEDIALFELLKGTTEPSLEVLAAAELNLCERNKAGLEMQLRKATVDQLIQQYLSHCAAQQPPHPTVSSSSSPEGHITPEGWGIGPGGQQGESVAGARGQALLQRLVCCVKVLRITFIGESLSPANRQALAVLFPNAKIVVEEQW